MAKGKKGKQKRAPGSAPDAGAARVAKLPKKKCCESSSRCHRCPLRMLKEGTLPAGYTVRKRKLVTVDKAARLEAEKQAKKAKKAGRTEKAA